eukprot:3362123-Pyramimonas_sp.AAC.1
MGRPCLVELSCEGSRGLLGRLGPIGPSGGHLQRLGPITRRLLASWRPLDPSLGIPGPCWGPPGAFQTQPSRCSGDQGRPFSLCS